MSEQKYYVRLRNIVDNNQSDNWLINGAGTMHKLGTVRPSFSTNLGLPKISLTKSELAEIMDGALYKSADYCEFMELPSDWVMNDKTDKWLCEWINPLIELVPVEGNE